MDKTIGESDTMLDYLRDIASKSEQQQQQGGDCNVNNKQTYSNSYSHLEGIYKFI
jgi:hypothetical protein